MKAVFTKSNTQPCVIHQMFIYDCYLREPHIALQVCRSLIELGVRFELEKFLADGCHTVDIVLRIPGKER